jgi:hypothetical protein
MKAWLAITAALLLLAFAAPAICTVVLLLAFLFVTFANAGCIWRSIRHKEHHSLVPLIGGICGCVGLWLGSAAKGLSALHLPSGAWCAAPFLLDIGTPMLLFSIPSLIVREIRASRDSNHA